MDWTSIAFEVLPFLTAVACGGLIGWDRESNDKPAGLRTHMMVALGAAAFAVCGLEIAKVFASGPGGAGSIQMDPLRVIEGVATGIGFLGAGSIIRSRSGVKGLTTAAGIWATGAIGAACGARLYSVAVLGTVLSLLILRVVQAMKN